jgi:hypothetical protein
VGAREVGWAQERPREAERMPEVAREDRDADDA